MKLEELQHKLILVARANRPSESVPYAFEQRVMARLRAGPTLDEWGLWATALWRATAPCLGIMLLLSVWTWLSPGSGGNLTDLSQALDNTVLAAADVDSPNDALR